MSRATEAKPPFVLVIDNDHSVRVRFRTLLEGAGCQVATATDGGMARTLLHTLVRRPALILVELSTRGVDGPEFLSEIGGHPELRAIPVIALGVPGAPAPEGTSWLAKDATDEDLIASVFASARR